MFERTFLITTVTHDRKPLFHSVPMADLFIENMYEYREKGKFFLHEFVLISYSSANPRFELDLPAAAKAGVF